MHMFSSPARGRARYAVLLFALAAGLPAFAAAAPAAPAVLPDSLAQRIMACTACHASKERSDAFFPRISGKPAGYLYNQLLNFRDGRRQYPLMTYMIEHMPDAYLREIAQYFSEQHPPAPPAQPSNATAAMLERGRSLVTLGDPAKKVPACIACHGEQLTGVAPAIPGLLGLPRDYVNAQFGAWKNHARRAQAPDCMSEVANRLSDADIAAVSSWLGTQVAAADARPATAVKLPLPLRCGGVPQ
ncbi:c-type cytochrome [Janthinobacterium fluminis]|uniref:C-type cytochrome n=1 Tax=Janthinobacterium fluminis TaxID=2987524 RepID=A0ABT5K552_9BURK|nr:c-type cytochrome [Janthinobacterium fluminis]MDC8760134.1 c-type cytochrome [Janthinobacterium fluminis]